VNAIGPPPGLLIEITSRCNLTCVMCPLTAGDTPSSKDPGHIAPEIWSRVLEFARSTGRANVGGYGEPLSNQKCLTYLRELDAAGVRISLTTNATMVNEKIAREIAAIAGIVNVNVSVDSPDADLYRAIRGGELDHALRGVAHLAAALGPDRLTISSVMMRRNVASLATFPAKLADMGLRRYVLQGLVDYTPGLEPEDVLWGEGLDDAVADIRRAAAAAGVELILELPSRTTSPRKTSAAPAPIAPASRSEADARQCFAPWDEPVVDKDGRVFPCCYAMTHGKAVLGDLRQDTFEAIWHGRMFQGFRRAITDGRTLPGICQQCTVAPAGPHLYRELAAEVLPDQSMLAGDSRLRLVVRNAGTATWTRDTRIHIGTTAPRDRASAFHHPSWIGANRIATFRESSVPPGGTATFEFDVTPAPGVAAEAFQLVAEGRAWLPGVFELRPAPGPARRPGLGGVLHRLLHRPRTLNPEP
jgi:radical SAM protein with 4Fe4S-binding SPASM domain